MTTSRSLAAGSTIESAAALFGSTQCNPFRTTNSSGKFANSFSDKQRHAMSLRLEQLEDALIAANTEPDETSATNLSPVIERRKTGAGWPLMTNLVSALLGGGLMWLALHSDPLPAKPLPNPEAQAVATKPSLAKPLATPAIDAKAAIDDEKRVGDLLGSWRDAWSQRDIGAYLQAYSKDFSPTDGSPRDAWVAARTKKLSAGAPITIRIHDLVVERLDANQFKTTFRQDYAAGSYREMARAKTLLIVREDGAWRIQKELLD